MAYPVGAINKSSFEHDITDALVAGENERGVATSRDGETRVGFHEIDFVLNQKVQIKDFF